MIKYKMIKEFSEKELKDLFLSVNWSSGKYPEKLKIAMLNSDTVITAWDGEKLIGLMNAMSDKIMTVYFHYLLVDPNYQGQGIGKILINQMLEKYKTFTTKILISYDSGMEFYKKVGFDYHDNKKPMFITDLTT